jgi:acyl transferase domain-containing protein
MIDDSNTNLLSQMKRPVIYAFSGQGSQHFHMAAELFRKHDVFKNKMFELDELAQQNLNVSILQHLYDTSKKRTESFDDIFYSQTALFMIEFSLAHTLSTAGIHPDYVFAASAGELAAAVVAKCVSVEDAMEIAAIEGRIFREKCSPGTMLAILNSADIYDDNAVLQENSEIAAINNDSHFVVAGTGPGIALIERTLKAQKITCLRLPVKQAFHSTYIDGIKKDIKAAIAPYHFNKPEIPIISCTFASVLKVIPADYIWGTIRKPINILETCHACEALGDFDYFDLGPGGTIGNLIKKNIKPGSHSTTHQILTPFGNDFDNLTKIVDKTSMLKAFDGKSTPSSTTHSSRTKAK